MIKQIFLFLFCLILFSCSKNIYHQKEYYINFKNTEGRICVKLKVNKYKEGNFYFDTGANRFVIDSSFYKNQKMSFENYSQTQSKGVGNVMPKMIKIYDTIHFSMNKNSFLSNQNIIHNLKKNLGKNIDGIFGVAHFGNAPFKIDYIKRKVILNPQIDESYQEVKIMFDENLMYLPVEIILANGTIIRGNLGVDTGARESMLTSEFANNKDVSQRKKSIYIHNGGIGGLHLGYSLFFSKVKINKFILLNRKFDINKDISGALSKNDKDIGIIGNDILSHFDIIYHPTQNKIWMKPNKNFNKPSGDLYKSFILIETTDKDKGWMVGGIYEDTDAYQKGLRHQDEVLEINNTCVKKLNLQKWNNKLKPNQKIKLKVKRGNDYFEIDTYLNVFLKKND